jgi:proline iminopeptidase
VVGSSCGGQLAIAYALKYQKNLKSMTTVGGLANVPFVAAEMGRMKSALPPDVVATLEKYEELGAYDDPKYIKAADVFYRKHVCRLKEWPEEVSYSFDHVSKPVYNTMNGPNEFTIIGNIRYWDVTARLGSIKVPTLVTCGKYDEVSPREARSLHRGIGGSKLVVFQKSSHMPFWEERAKFMRVLGRFLDGSA